MNFIRNLGVGLLLLSATTASEAASTKVYKQLGPNGEVVFTDTPPLEGTETIEEIKVGTDSSGVNLNKQTNAPLNENAQKQKEEVVAEDVKRRYEIVINTPKDGSVFGADTLDIAMGVSLIPEKLFNGDRLQVLVDGVVALPLLSDLAFKLPLLPAGVHSIQVQVLSNTGIVLGEKSVQITQLRSSVPSSQQP